MSYSVLIVSHDAGLRLTRAALFTNNGYTVDTALNAKNAILEMASFHYDLVVVGRNSLSDKIPIDQQIRNNYPSVLILKIVDPVDRANSFASRMTDATPHRVLAAAAEMLTNESKGGVVPL